VLIGLTTDDQVFIRHCVSGHWGDLEREEAILSTAQRDGREVAIRHEQEPGSGGKRDALMTTRMLGGFDVAADIPGASKEVRQRAYAAQWQAGNVIIETDGPYGKWDWRTFLNVHVAVPQGKTRDEVDAASAGYNLLILGEGTISYDATDYPTVQG
jgi:phage terminase large subunit-like protein